MTKALISQICVYIVTFDYQYNTRRLSQQVEVDVNIFFSNSVDVSS